MERKWSIKSLVFIPFGYMPEQKKGRITRPYLCLAVRLLAVFP